MKKLLLALLCLGTVALTASADVTINQSSFPDAIFRNYVTQFDLNGNGVLSQAELDAVTEVSVVEMNISSLVGVKNFRNLVRLYCGKNNLTTLDVSGLSSLEELFCNGNQLTSININGLTSLVAFYCLNNNLVSLDLRGLTSLQSCSCNNNNLTSLEISGLENLAYFYCSYNNLTSIDLSNQPKLRRFECTENKLTSLDVSQLPELWVLRCGYNNLESLDLTGLNKLEVLEIYGCGFKGEVMDDIINSLVTYNSLVGKIEIATYNNIGSSSMTPIQVQEAREKGWNPQIYAFYPEPGFVDYDGEWDTNVAVIGDVNGDGYVTSADVTALYNYLLNDDTSSIVRGDLDGDGFITTGDVTVVYNILLNGGVPVKEFTLNGVKFNMVDVEGGTFMMGAAANDTGADSSEKPAHQVTLTPFIIGQTEVTQELWEEVMGNNPSYHIGTNMPVEQVSWNDCKAFITNLNQMFPIDGYEFNLPTEAQWEFAARGGNESKGYKYSGSNTIGDVAWYTGNSGSMSHQVATKAPNELGIYDMGGNVEEWCLDHYYNYSAAAQFDPNIYTYSSYPLINLRGGYFTAGESICRNTHRDSWDASQSSNEIGLRLVLVPSKVEFEVNGIKFNMVKVEGGTFTMGASDNDTQASSCEKPAHEVKVKSFCIGETEVTQGLWQAVMGNNPSYFVGSNNTLPVEWVSWDDCQEFITKLNQMLPIAGHKFRMPTEAEWEFAARGGNKSHGCKYAGNNYLSYVGHYNANATTFVASFYPNELGIYDMSGNVLEWCQDWYDENYYSNSLVNNPQGPSSGTERVFRGGSWLTGNVPCRVTARARNTPDWHNFNVGLRLVLAKDE